MSTPHGPQAALIRFSLRLRGAVIAAGCLLLGYGLYALAQAKYDVFPEFAPPEVVIQTEAPGLAPEQVEILVTQPLENVLNGVPGLDSLRSGSIQGLSVITATFDSSTDIYRARQLVGERLGEAIAQLPRGVAPPIMAPLTSAASLVLVIGLTSQRHSLMELRATAEWLIRPRLLAVPGVSKVAIFGRDRKSIQVQIHPDALSRFGLALNDVLAIAQRASGVRGGGFIEGPNQRIVLQTEAQSPSPDEIARTVLTSAAGTSLTLGDVATVKEAPEPAIGAATINAEPGVVLNISEQYRANTLEVSRSLDAALTDLRPSLAQAGITLHDSLFRPANFINAATGNVGRSLLLGGALVIAVLFLFLYDLRSAAISCIAIPLSLLAAVIVLERLDITLNTMTLGGLAIAIGVVVDDAVVDLENIIRRLRENQQRARPASRARVILDASIEVRAAVVYATFAVLFVVFPIVTLSGLAGRLFAPLGIAYAIAVLASLLITLTLTPALAMVFLKDQDVSIREPPLMRWSKQRYQRLLTRITHHPRLAIAIALTGSLLGCALLPFLQGSFIPALKEAHFTVHMATVPGTSVAESLRIGNLVTRTLRALPAVRQVAQRAGRGELADDTYGPHYSEFEVELKPLNGEESQAVQGQIRARLADIPGANFLVYTFLSERIDETLSGYTAPVVVNIFGSDLDVLDRKAQEVAQVLSGIHGAADVSLPSPPGLPQLSIRLRQADLERWGLDPLEVQDAIATAYQGDTVGQAYEGNRVFPIVAILDPSSRSRVDQVADLPLRTPAGSYVRLKQVADLEERSGRYQVLHSQAQRMQSVTANVVGRALSSFVQEAQRRIRREVALPPGTYIQLAGEAPAQSRSVKDLAANSAIALVGIVLLLAIITRNIPNLLLLLASLPFALVGGVLAVFAMGGALSLGAMVGFIALLGITLRNSILLIAHYQHLVGEGGQPWTLATAILGASDRLTPILMTSLVTALGVLPLALGMGEPGREIEGPMAAVILGGLVSSTVLNLLVLPSLALAHGRFETALGQNEELLP
jgi:CzcA family heavy metal efflux pump